MLNFKIKKKNFLDFVIISYLVVLTAAGDLIDNIAYADLYSIFFLIYILLNLRFLNKNFLVISFIILTYTFVLGLISVINERNTLFIVFIMILKMINFMVILTFGYLCCKSIVKSRNFYLPIISLIIIIFFISNIISEAKQYYGYVALPSISAPSNSGISLASLTVFGFILIIFNKDKGRGKLLTNLSIMGLLIMTLFVQTRTTFYSLLITGMLLFAYNFYVKNKSIYKIIFVSFFLIFTFLYIYFNSYLVTDFFPRTNFSNLIYNLEFRYNKFENFYTSMCQNNLCTIFGTGIGSHAYYNGILALSIDSLFGKFKIEWGIVGSFLWFIYFINLVLKESYYKNQKKKYIKLNVPIFTFLFFGALVGLSSEFIFVSYSGSFYALLLGALYGHFTKKILIFKKR